MTDRKKDEYVQTINSATGEVGYILKSDLENPEKYELLQDQNGKIIVMTKDQYKKYRKEMDGMRGCFAVFIIVGAIALLAGSAWLVAANIKKEKEAKHTNVIVRNDTTYEKLIISDIDSKEERLVDYSEYNFKQVSSQPSMKEKIKRLKTGDTVVFKASTYNDRRKFELGPKSNYQHALYFSADSVIARMKAEKLKQDKDTLASFKQNQR